MQRTPPPPPPGHCGTYRVPTGILTRATYRHQATQPTAASQPQRGAFPYAQQMTHFAPQPVFPPQPPPFRPTFHRPHHALSPHQHYSHSFTTPPLPSDFVPSEHYHDCKVVYGYDLPKAVKATTYTQKLGIAGCPIETVPLLAIVRHSWSWYWRRYLCHGNEIFPVFTELFSRLNHNKIDLDTVALAHCQGAIPPIPNPTKKQALAALADEFYEYMSGLIHETPSQNTTSTDQQSNQRILQLEQQLTATRAQLAAANGNQDTPTTPTKKRPPPSPSPATSSAPPPPNSGSKPAALPVASSQATPTDTPTPVPPNPTATPFSTPSSKSSKPIAVEDSPQSAIKRRKVQTTLPGAPTKPAKPDIFTEPPGTSQWFSQNFTGAYSEAGIQRWIGSLRISEPKKQEIRTNIQTLLKQYPCLSDQQTEQLQKNAETWGLPPQHIRKLQANHLISILSVICHFTE